MTRWLRLAPLLAALACAGGETVPAGDAVPPEPVPEAKTILLGEYGSLSGSEATFGQSTHNGVLLAIKEINAAGGVSGKQLEVKVYDDQGKTQEAGSAVSRLITEDKAVAIIGEVASSLSIAGGRVAQQYGVPMVSPSSTNAQVTAIGDMVFRVCFIDGFQGYVGAKFAKDDLKLTKAAILYDQSSAYSKGLKDDFTREFTGLGGQVVAEQAYDAGNQDFSAQLTTIRGTSPDAIFIPGYYTDVGNIALQARKLGVKAVLLGGDGWDSSKLAEIGGEAIDGAYYSNHYAPEETRPEVQRFVEAYQKEYGAVPDGLAALGYDATRVIADAMKRSPSLGGKDLAAALAATRDFPGVTGKITIDAKRDAQKPAVVVQMKGGKPTWVTTILPPGMGAPIPEAPPAAPTEN
jgi:branched-chain amino acid transport system substrate-binding protein